MLSDRVRGEGGVAMEAGDKRCTHQSSSNRETLDTVYNGSSGNWVSVISRETGCPSISHIRHQMTFFTCEHTVEIVNDYATLTLSEPRD